ncbi:LytR family transcriptional regulator [Pseudonocardiaceae bacterium YIM PH 21723]|nr:LytR family transcriptional regulator [Pseudonocardiaceae bacterium YIM PH 21723]
MDFVSGRIRGLGRAVFSALAVVILVGTAIAWVSANGVLSGLTTSDALGDAAKSKDGATNILLIGLDSRKDQDGNQLPKEILDQLHAGDGNEGGYNTNTLILMHVPNDGSKAVAFSIPRDDYVSVSGIKGYSRAKIKEAYGLKKAETESALVKKGVSDRHELETQSREAGRKATIQTVQDFLGVPIDQFAEVNLAGFYDLANALDGVEVCLNNPVHDSFSGADFPAGRQTLNGAQSLAFVRQRHGLDNGDLDRTRRQQAFIASVSAKLRSSGTFTDIGRMRKLIDTAQQDVVISKGWDVLAFAQQAQNLTGGNLQFSTLPIEGFQKINGQDVNKVDVAKVRKIVQVAFGLKSAPAETPRGHSTVDVYNASGASGLAATVATGLTGKGFQQGEVGNAVATTNSSVAYGPGASGDGDVAGTLLGIQDVRSDSRVPRGHLKVVIGSDFTLPAGLEPTTAPPPQAGAAGEAAAQPTGSPKPGGVDGSGIPCVD